MPVFDSSVLLLALDPNVKAPTDPATNKPVEYAVERVEHFIEGCVNRKERIIIPTPVLSEVLVHADEAWDDYLDILGKPPFSIVPVDKKAALETAKLLVPIFRRGTLRNTTVTKTKIKFDRLIVAVAKSQEVNVIYSDDQHIHNIANQAGITARRTVDILLPEGMQLNFFDKLS